MAGVHFAGPLYVDGVQISSVDIGYVDGITPGTATASKAVVLDSSKGISTITSATITTLTSTTVNTTNLGSTTLASGGKITLDKTTGTCTSNAVTISKQAGVITTEALTTAAGASQAITLTNTLIASTSVVLCQVQGGTNTRNSFKLVAVPGSGSAVITIYNTEPTNALNGTIIFSFVVV